MMKIEIDKATLEEALKQLSSLKETTNHLEYALNKMSGVPSELKTLNTLAVDIALKQKGIRELTGKNDGEAIRKFQENIRGLQGEPWCASFVSYCFKEAAKELGQERPFRHIPGVYTLTEMAQSNGWFIHAGSAIPKKGDIFVMSGDHTGLVISYNSENKTIKTIEGNLNDSVDGRELPKQGKITGYIRVS